VKNTAKTKKTLDKKWPEGVGSREVRAIKEISVIFRDTGANSTVVLAFLITWWINNKTDTVSEALDFFREMVAPMMERSIKTGLGR